MAIFTTITPSGTAERVAFTFPIPYVQRYRQCVTSRGGRSRADRQRSAANNANVVSRARADETGAQSDRVSPATPSGGDQQSASASRRHSKRVSGQTSLRCARSRLPRKLWCARIVLFEVQPAAGPKVLEGPAAETHGPDGPARRQCPCEGDRSSRRRPYGIGVVGTRRREPTRSRAVDALDIEIPGPRVDQASPVGSPVVVLRLAGDSPHPPVRLGVHDPQMLQLTRGGTGPRRFGVGDPAPVWRPSRGLAAAQSLSLRSVQGRRPDRISDARGPARVGEVLPVGSEAWLFIQDVRVARVQAERHLLAAGSVRQHRRHTGDTTVVVVHVIEQQSASVRRPGRIAGVTVVRSQPFTRTVVRAYERDPPRTVSVIDGNGQSPIVSRKRRRRGRCRSSQGCGEDRTSAKPCERALAPYRAAVTRHHWECVHR